jgi:cellulose synthase/poly-beta-1,6-N-acetylglucosamine synthase-like glycosyltransferase
VSQGEIMNVAIVLVLVSFLFLILLLLGYPITIYILSRMVSKKTCKEDIAPTVTLVIPCYNENHVIREKIENTRLIDYPRNSLEIVVVDSASTDGTGKTLREISNQYDIKLIEQTKREGKAAAINVALRKVTSEIVVLTDADAFLGRDVIRKMVRNFADPTVGAVVARYKMEGSSLLSKLVSLLFSIFREKVRHYESNIDSASFFTGELLAYRRVLVEAIDENAVADDQFILLKIRQKGYRCVTEPASEVLEYIPDQARQTFQHRRRTMYGTLYVSAMFKDLLFRRKYGFFGCYIFPMSIARIVLLPVACFFFEISLLYLLASVSMNFLVVVAIILLCLLVLSFAFRRNAIPSIFSVLILQTAMILGIVDFLTGNPKHRVWSKLKKSHSTRSPKLKNVARN